MRSKWILSLIATLAVGTAAQANPINMVLDFDTDALGNSIDRGQVIDDEYAAWGVNIVTENLRKNFDYGIAFDSENPTGGDSDLRTGAGSPHDAMGNVLIISERNSFNSSGNIATPDDEGGRPAGYFDFFFDNTQLGGHVSLLDIEGSEPGTIELFSNNSLVTTFNIAGLGNNSFQTIDFGNELFDRVRVNMGGSGAVTEVAFGNVPEPASLGLLGLGALALLGRKRRERTTV